MVQRWWKNGAAALIIASACAAASVCAQTQSAPALAGTGTDTPPAPHYTNDAPLFTADGHPVDDRVAPEPLTAVIANRDLVKYDRPHRTSAPPGTIEVIYFFWYGSPWAARVDQPLRAWAASRPYAVRFVPFPVIFSGADTDPAHQVQVLSARIFFALQKLGKENDVGPLFLTAVHHNFVSLTDMGPILDWMDAHGVARKDFMDAINSPEVKEQTATVPYVVASYMPDGASVPAVVLDGTYMTRATDGQSLSHWLGVVEFTADHLARGGPRP